MSSSGSEKTIDEHWVDFKSKFNKSYEDENEDSKRKDIFKANFEKIQKHNELYEKGQVTYTMGINKFSDLTKEEFSSCYTGVRKPDEKK